MSEVLLETGWDGGTSLRFVGCDLEPCRLSDWYKAEHGGKLTTNLAAFQREAQIQKHMQDNAGGAYGITIPGAGKYGRSDYGGNLK
jgi:hypothetical protein